MRMVVVGAPVRVSEAEALGATVQFVEGPLDGETQTIFWLGQMRAAPDVMWLDWAALTSPDVELIHQYRILRGQVRIVVEVPATLQPPDAAMAALVSWGIYDLVSAAEPLQTVLERRPTYGDVARWHTPDNSLWGVGEAPLPDPEIAAAQTVAVISGKGGVGKTSFVASCLIAAAPWGAVGIDADFVKPSLQLAFHAPNDESSTSLERLLTTRDLRRRESGDPTMGDWTNRDRADIRQWVHEAELVAQGVRLVSGPSRLSPLPTQVPAGLILELVEAAKKVARLTLIDTPGSTNEDSWVEAIQAADWIVLVTTPDYPAVLEAVDVLRKLDYLHIARSRIWLVISQRGRTGYSTSEIVQTHLPLPLLAVIPEDRAKWHRAWRLHQPPALRDRTFWAAIVRKMTGVDPDRPVRKNPFRWRRPRMPS